MNSKLEKRLVIAATVLEHLLFVNIAILVIFGSLGYKPILAIAGGIYGVVAIVHGFLKIKELRKI